MKRSVSSALCMIFLLLLVFIGLRHVPLFRSEEVTFHTSLPVTASMERIRLSLLGENGWALEKSRVEKEIEEIPYIEDCEVNVRARKVDVTLTEKEGILISGARRNLFWDGKELSALSEGDAKSLEGRYLSLLLETGRAAYIEEWGLSPEFERVARLMLELSACLCYNADLVSYGSYESSQGPGFGTLKLVSEPLNTVFLIHEDTDGEWIGKLLLEAEKNGPADLLEYEVYEIKDNTLYKRKKGE